MILFMESISKTTFFLLSTLRKTKQAMAEGILFNFVGEIITKLTSHAFKELGMVWGVKDDITKLTNSASSIKAVLLDAENQQSHNETIKDWLQKLKHAFYDVEDVIDEFSCEALRRQVMTRDKRAKQVRIFFSKNNQVAFAFKMARKIKNVRENLDAITADRSKFQLTEQLQQKGLDVSKRVDTHSLIPEDSVVGRNDDKEKIKNYLLDMKAKQHISFIAVTGMGGLGKTTLAKFLYNDKEVSMFFDLKIWVCVSESFDVSIVVKNIIESATKKTSYTYGMEALQNQLQEVIGGKKYLLILDDVWNENEEKWSELKVLLMSGARGSKIVITKRDSKVAVEIDDMTLLYNLEGLSKENSWSLFRKVTFKGGEPNNPNLIQLGKEIVRKCRGNPLVIKSIGSVLRSKTSEEEWMSLKDRLQLLPENDVIPNLKLSYDHLPSSYLKQCFAYCSLFPKDYSIMEDELIRQAIAHGFVQSSDPSKSIEDMGDDYFMELCWRSMLQSSGPESVKEKYINPMSFCPFSSMVFGMVSFLSVDKKEYTMHDLMHDLAQRVTNGEYKCISSEDEGGVNERTRHISFDGKLYPKRGLPTSLIQAKGLRTFLLHNDDSPRIEFNSEFTLDKLLSNFVCLRVLKLNRSNIGEVPKSINKLRQLRYLDLSGNSYLELLPNSITELQNLQTLDLHFCFNLQKLPRDMNDLVNLRHLDLHGTLELSHLPKGIGKLTGLQTFNKFVLSREKKKNTSELSELRGLNHLRGLLHIQGLERTTPSEASLASLKDKKGLRHLILEWEWSVVGHEVNEMVLEGLEPYANVEFLGIKSYMGGRLSNWVSSLNKLTEIQIMECSRLEQLPRFDQLPALKRLILIDLSALEFIDNKDTCSSSVFFPSLQVLHLNMMPNLKAWWKWKPHFHLLPSFPPLLEFLVDNCPELASMPLHSGIKRVKLYNISIKVLEFPLARTLCSEDPYSANTFSPFAVESLQLNGIDELEFLPHQLWRHFNNLEYLRIAGCKNFKGPVSVCEDGNLQMGECKNLVESLGEVEEIDKKQGKLKILVLWRLPELVSLPIRLQHLTTLLSLEISHCYNFTHLPEWIGSLVSLEMLKIEHCPKLKLLPEGMRQLISLHTLRIVSCDEVEERCKQGGEDWPKIAHVPEVSFKMKG